jgi:hypothetical protein
MKIFILFEDFFREIEAFSGLRDLLDKFIEEQRLFVCEAFTKNQRIKTL